MTDTVTVPLGLQLREDDPAKPTKPGVAATLYGRAVPYGEAIDLGGIRAEFAPGAFDAGDASGRPLCWRHDEPIGVVTAAHSRDDGLYVTAEVADTALGRDAATLLRSGAVTGLSVGFTPSEDVWDKARTAVTRRVARLRELSLTHMPAYASAQVATIREEAPMSDVTTVDAAEPVAVDSEAREAIATIREAVEEVRSQITVHEPHPLAQFRTLGDYAKAVWTGATESRAIAENIMSESPGLFPPQWMNDVKNIVDLGRPAVTALGTLPAGASGTEFDWPYYDGTISAHVGAHGTELTDITSVQIAIKKGTATLGVYAGGSTSSFELLDRSSPSYLDAYLRVMAAAYAAATDNAFVDAVVSGAGDAVDYDYTADTDGKAFRAAVFEASSAVRLASGAPASVVLVASDVWVALGAFDDLVPAPYGTQNVSGTATAATLAVSVSGLPVVEDPYMAAGSIIVTNGTAAKWVEDGPRIVSSDVVTTLARSTAIYGYGCTATFNAAAIVALEAAS